MIDAANPAPESPPPADGAPLREIPRRFVSKAVAGLFAAALLITSFLWLLGLSESSAFRWLAVAAAMACGSIAAWELVERGSRRARPGLLAWLAFPVAWILGVGQMPFLALAVYPPLGEFLARDGRVEALYIERTEGRRLEIRFPREIDRGRGANNLRLDDVPLPEDYQAAHADRFAWLGDRTLSIDIVAVLADLELRSASSVTINADLASVHFRYANGESVPHQRVEVRAE